LRQMMLLLNSKTNIDISQKLISKDLKMKARYDYIPISHLDICTYFYTHSTSPMRRFVDINVHNLVFNLRSRQYIFKALDMDYINDGVDYGKSIFQLVGNQRFIDFIKINKNPIMKIKVFDLKYKTIGLVDLVNFFSFDSLFGLKKNDKIGQLKLDEFNLPVIEKTNRNKKVLNIFFHMLRQNRLNDKKLIKDIQKYLEIIFNVKKINRLC